MQKTKTIVKANKKSKQKEPKQVTDEQGDPLIKNLNDFVTAIKITHSSLPIYTGGRILATATHIYATCNAEVAVYSFQEGTVVDRIKHANEEIVNFCVCPLQKYIVTFTQSSLARVLLLETKKVLHTVKLSGAFANDIAFSPNGRHLAFALGNSVHIFTFETMKRTHTYNPTNSKFVITKLQWHPNPDSLQIFTADMQRNIAVFDYILNKVVNVSEAGEGGSDFCFTTSGATLVALNNLEVKVYETKGLQLKYKFETESYMEAIQAEETMLYVGGEDSGLISVDLSNPHDLKYREHPGCTDNGVMKLMWKGKNSKELLVLSVEQNITVAKVNGKQLSREGLIVGYNDQIIDIKTDKREGDMDVEIDGEYFVMVTNSNNVKLMNRKTNQMETLIQGHQNTVLCAEYWHPYIATAGKDKVIKLWKLEGQKVRLLANYHGHNTDIMGIAALQRNKIIASVSEDNTIKLWPMCLETDQQVEIKSALRTTVAHQKTINIVRASSKEDLLATASQDRTIKIWDLHLNNTLTLTGHKRGVWDVAFHPVEQLLVSVAGDGMLKGWNLQTGECAWSMGEGPALIRCQWIYYNQVITGSLDGIVKIWDIRKQTSLSYDKHEGKIWALDVSKGTDGKAIVMSGATDSVYHVWHDSTSELKEDIMHRHELEQQERIFYSQHMQDKNYTEAAIVAFKGNFLRLFLKVLEQMSVTFDPESGVIFQQDTGELILNQNAEETSAVSEEQFAGMVAQLKEIDISRLLVTIQEMNQTVRHYKMGHRLLRHVLTTTKFSELMDLNSSFVLPNTGEESLNEFNEKKSGMEKWLENMVSSGNKHSSRVERYIRGTYWIEHLHRQENPFTQ